ncbi:MAG: ribbon-helix-helix domain-containing protein [Propionibacteriaceae bacterium]|jgi:hypothetical protein|nr:ribbon-helix-helix domain-containing protein [Propionibacteriaceae bacterium]
MSKPVFTAEEVAQFEEAAAEAERGYATEFLDSRPRLGRPREVGDAVATVVPVRIDPQRLQLIDAAAQTRHVTRSQFIRDAIDRALANA